MCVRICAHKLELWQWSLGIEELEERERERERESLCKNDSVYYDKYTKNRDAGKQ